MSVLKENRVLVTNAGQMTLTSTLVADFLSVLGLSSYIAFQSEGPAWKLFLVLLLLLSGVFLYKAVAFWRGRAVWLDAAFSSMAHGTAQLPLRAVFALVFLLIVEAEVLGAEVILGAFIAGLILSLILGREGEPLREKLDVIGYGLLVPVFFIMVGARLDMRLLFRDAMAVPLVLGLLLVSLAINAVGSLFTFRQFGWKNAFSLEMLMLSRLSLAIAGASIGVKAGVISIETETAIVIFSVLTCVLGPVLFQRLRMPETLMPETPKTNWLVVGNGCHALRLADHLHNAGIPVTFATERIRLEQHPHSPGLSMHHVARIDGETLGREGLLDCAGVILQVGNDRRSLELARVLKHRLGVERVFAVVPDAMAALLLREIGVRAVSPEESEAFVMEQFVRVPALFDALTGEEGSRVSELQVFEGPLVGKTLMELGRVFPPSVRVLLVTREGEALLPKGDTTILEGDVLTLMGNTDAFEQLQPLCAEGGICQITVS